MTELAWTHAFTDDKGNRFIYPSFIRWPGVDEDKLFSKSDIILQAMTLNIALGTKSEEFEFAPEVFPHIKTDIGHRNFAHGGATIMLFAGPEFDKVVNESAEA